MAREGILEPCELVPLGETLDRQHFAAFRVGCQEAAGGHGTAVDEHRARAAHLHLARALGAGQPETVAQKVEQQLLRLDLANDGPLVDLELEPQMGVLSIAVAVCWMREHPTVYVNQGRHDPREKRRIVGMEGLM